MKTSILMGLLSLLVLLSGCNMINLDGVVAAASSTPTIVPLPTITESPATPTSSPSPSPSPVPASATPTLVPVTPSVTPSPTLILEARSAPAANQPAVGQPAMEEAATSNPSLSGEWDFTFGQMSLTQGESGVEGTYQWYGGADSGEIRGIMLEGLHQFQGLWVSQRDPNSQGFLLWQLAADRASFSGTYESSKTGQWCGVRSGQPLPDGCGFSDLWQVRFGNPPDVTGQATLTQTGSTVTGTFVDSQGHSGEIEGGITVNSLTEAKLVGTWRDDRGEEDSFEWQLDLTSGQTFQGRRDPGNSEWCGWREGAIQPEKCGW